MEENNYAGFWIRVVASIIDTILLLLVIIPILTTIYGAEYLQGEIYYFGIWDALFNYVFPAIVILLFWSYKSATPGKMVLKLKIVDAETGGKPSTKQLIIRYLGYYVSSIPLGLGIFWIAFDKRKQGWHDKMAGTLVVKPSI